MINPDFSDLLSAFAAHEVRFLVVGAYAVTFHARPRYTKDLDLWIAHDALNARRAWDALVAFGAPLGELEPADLEQPDVVLQIGVAPNRIDLRTSLTALEFERRRERRVASTYADVPIQLLSREDLIANKRALGRPHDLLDVRELGEADG